MINTDYHSLEITQKIIVPKKNFHTLQSGYLIKNIPNAPLNVHTSNFEDDLFVVDWQLSMEENSGVDNHWY